MSVSNVIYELTSFSRTFPTSPQFRESHQENHFDGQSIIIQDSNESLVRASAFITYLARILNAPKESKLPLQALLERSLHLPATEENKPLFSEITQAFFKQKGYLSRLFSNESWEEWFENRTALGKIASQFRNCIESRAEESSFMKAMNPQLIQKANEEATVLLKRLGSREATSLPKSSCLYGLTSGIAASFLLENPLPFFLGLSACFPRASAQQKVGNEFQVNTYTTNNQWHPSVASFSNGNFVVAWESWLQDGSGYAIYAQLFDRNGSKIGSEFQVNTYTANWQESPSVASFSNGNFVVTWQSDGQDGSVDGVYGQLFDGNGSKIGNEFQVNTYTVNYQMASSVSSLADSNFVVTWASNGQDGSDYGVYGQLFNGNGTKIGIEFRANTYVTLSQAYPSVASFSNGNFVVTWSSYDQDGSKSGIYAQLFDGNGSKIGNEFQVNNFTADSQDSPSIASLTNGNFVVTWHSWNQDGSESGVYGQLFAGNSTKIGSEFRANTFVTRNQGASSVAGLVDGNFVVTWQSNGQDGSSHGVYGQLFDENGSNIGGEFQVNTYTPNNQLYPSVASLADGNFVVTWDSWAGQDSSDSGVYGQIFNDFLVSSTTSTSTASSTTSSVSTSITSTTTTSSTTSSVSTSITSMTTTSSMTSSVSTSTISVTGRTRTSVNPSSSRITVPSTTRPIITRNRRATLSSTSDPRNHFSWIWFLLGGVGVVSCLCLMGYFIFKSRNRKKDGDVHALELGEREKTDDSTAETQYQRTPDFVTERAGEGPIYGLTPDVVTAVSDYQFTPDVVAARDGGN